MLILFDFCKFDCFEISLTKVNSATPSTRYLHDYFRLKVHVNVCKRIKKKNGTTKHP